jgi:hypothetical protein
MKYILVTGGVISGIGKGVVARSVILLQVFGHSLRRVVPATNLVKFGEIWQLKKLKNLNHLEVLSLFAFVVNHSK